MPLGPLGANSGLWADLLPDTEGPAGELLCFLLALSVGGLGWGSPALPPSGRRSVIAGSAAPSLLLPSGGATARGKGVLTGETIPYLNNTIAVPLPQHLLSLKC